MQSSQSLSEAVQVKAVWELNGDFYTLRLHGLGRVELDEPDTYYYYDSKISADKPRYKFIVDIDDDFTITQSDEDPTIRTAIADIKKINLEELRAGMKMRGIPEDASFEIDPYDGGNLVKFTWKEL